MSIVLVRVDNRLIHGQVLEAWVPYLKADHILVVDDDVASDCFRRKLMESVAPSTLKVVICSHEQLLSICENNEMAQAKVLVLFADPVNALQAYRQGFNFKTLNLGNMHIGEHKCCISKTLYMGDDDFMALEQLSLFGVDITAQCVPTDHILHWDCDCCKLR
ncbi:MAG: hypothetical protein B6I36_02685 [Desulfobacteraceae bacterium 4572_35.1]|nr:MAG: hypothetical protein B6I36_02685 [Desulfobacteraceae bacterium 4572_35.1]